MPRGGGRPVASATGSATGSAIASATAAAAHRGNYSSSHDEAAGASEIVEGDAILSLMLARTTPRLVDDPSALPAPVRPMPAAATPARSRGGTKYEFGLIRRRTDDDGDGARPAKREAAISDPRRRQVDAQHVSMHVPSPSIAHERVETRHHKDHARKPTARTTKATGPRAEPSSPRKAVHLEVVALRARNQELETQSHDLQKRNSELQEYVDEFERHCGVLV